MYKKEIAAYYEEEDKQLDERSIWLAG